jgi:hypothetical protein
MMTTLGELSRLGYEIELRQIDSDLSARSKIPFQVSSASPSELKQYQISAVPVLLVGDIKRQTFFKLQGYQPKEAVLQALQTHSRQNNLHQNNSHGGES